MRIMIDHETGELQEVEDRFIHDFQPYGYREAKAAVMRASTERRDAIKVYAEAVREEGAAQRAYRSLKAREVLKAKADHGSTVAGDVAFENEELAAAKERVVIAEGMKYAAVERLRLCTEDRQSLSQLIAWSRAVDSSTFEQAGA